MVTPQTELIDVYYRGVADFQTLNKTEQLQFIFIITRIFRTLHEQYFHWREGALPETIWVSWLAQFNDAMKYPGWQEVWSRRRHWFDKDFQSVVDRCVTETKRVRPLYEAPER